MAAMELEPESAEWTIAWTLRKHAKTPNDRVLDMAPEIARDITDALERSNWRLIKLPLDVSFQ
jgi:hypothetical protein